ncbi:MAG: MBOAT family O-acyltransferase [Candidatus Poribacteria bacterium]
MIFNEVGYYCFFLLPSILLFHLSKYSLRPWIITITGVLFFIYFGGIHFGGLFGSLAVIILLWEMLTSRFYKPKSLWSIFGVVQAIIVLCYFKYSGFFITIYNDLLNVFKLSDTQRFSNPILPLGISFFTFEFIHFASDRYKGKIGKTTLGEYGAFIFFFPTMVAGPIKRFEEFIPKLRCACVNLKLINRGITRILVGLAKKHALADTFGLISNSLNTDALYQADGITIIFWIFAYGMKIYFDFSGYSDIAIGSAYLFGIPVPENFNWPYLSRNIAEFWRRWHISLGRWIFDYVYVAVGGSLRSPIRTGFNLIMAFAVSGIWHGAAYNFIAWGLWHGIMMVIYRFWSYISLRLNVRLPAPVSIMITFIGVNLGWGLFCMDIKRAVFSFSKILAIL